MTDMFWHIQENVWWCRECAQEANGQTVIPVPPAQPAAHGRMTAREFYKKRYGYYPQTGETFSIEAVMEFADAFAAERCRGLERERDRYKNAAEQLSFHARLEREQRETAESCLREREEQIAKRASELEDEAAKANTSAYSLQCHKAAEELRALAALRKE